MPAILILIATLLAFTQALSGERPGWYQALGPAGTLRGSLYSHGKIPDGNSDFGAGSLWLTLQPGHLGGFGAFFDGRAQAQGPFPWGDSPERATTEVEVREAYADFAMGGFDLRAGRQITVWGRADKINPTDVWSVRDYTLPATDDEDQRLGLAAVRLAYGRGPFRLSGLWQPEWRPPILPIAKSPGLSLRNLEPDDAAAQAGAKLDYSGSGLDGSLSYSHVLDRVPDLEILSRPTAAGAGAEVGLRYAPIDVFGADAAFSFGEYGARAEIAYTLTRDQEGTDPFTKNRNLFAVIGADRTWAGTFNVNLQYLYRWTFDYQKAEAVEAAAAAPARMVNLLSNQLAAHRHGMSFRISHKAWNETLESEVAGAVWAGDGDFTLRPKASYALSDRWKAVAGAEIFYGPDGSYFGRLSKASAAFTELRMGF